jgi:hypothetical protein
MSEFAEDSPKSMPVHGPRLRCTTCFDTGFVLVKVLERGRGKGRRAEQLVDYVRRRCACKGGVPT